MSMEANQKTITTQKPVQASKGSQLSKNVKKYYMEFEDIFIRKTQSDRRRELFGKDPMVNI